MSNDTDAEHTRQWELIRTPLNLEWSGRTRYAAAMYFYHRGDWTAEALEVYRICSRLDFEDPMKIMEDRGIGMAWIAGFRRKQHETE